jgi:hypothetical protein
MSLTKSERPGKKEKKGREKPQVSPSQRLWLGLGRWYGLNLYQLRDLRFVVVMIFVLAVLTLTPRASAQSHLPDNLPDNLPSNSRFNPQLSPNGERNLNEPSLYRPAQNKFIINPPGPGESLPVKPKPPAQRDSVPATPKPPAQRDSVPNKSKPPTSVDSVADLHGCWINEQYANQESGRNQFLYYCFDQSGTADCYTAEYDSSGRFLNDCHFKSTVKMTAKGFTIAEHDNCPGWSTWVYDCQLKAPGKVNCVYTNVRNQKFPIDLSFQGAVPPRPSFLKR